MGFKVHLLEQKSIRNLYINSLKGELTPVTGKVHKDCLEIKQAITEAAEETTGYKN
jgi:hypothetical protein